MTLQIIILLGSLALLIFGAEWIVDGSSAIARRAGLSEFLIGLTVVGIGTSMPELAVSTVGALNGSADISIGNIVGSNIFNPEHLRHGPAHPVRQARFTVRARRGYPVQA